MNKVENLKKLKLFLRIYGVLTLLIFGNISLGFLLQYPELNPGGTLHWLIWDKPEGHVAPMLFVIYLVWGVFLLLAANNPRQYRSFLAFTMWANLAHGLLMIPMALFDPTHLYHSKLLTDIPFIIGLSVGIYLLQPKQSSTAS